MALFIAIPVSDLGEVLLTLILSLILARLLFSTGDGIGPYNMGVIFHAGFCPFSLLFLPLLFPVLPDLI